MGEDLHEAESKEDVNIDVVNLKLMGRVYEKQLTESDHAMNQADPSSAAAPRPIPIQANKYLSMQLPIAQGDQAEGRGVPSKAGTQWAAPGVGCSTVLSY
jgi:hypothetical protein